MAKKRSPGSVPVQSKPASIVKIRSTPARREAFELWPNIDILFLIGPAGTGKTHLAVSLAVKAIREGVATKIIASRPTVQAGEDLGFLPGDLGEKLDPYMTPIFDVLKQVKQPDEQIEVERAPLAFMRGRTFTDSVAILDEAQNCTYKQLKLFLTRIGQNNKLIITGDPEQSDLPGGVESLEQMLDDLDGVKRIGIIDIPETEVVRHPLIMNMLSRFRD